MNGFSAMAWADGGADPGGGAGQMIAYDRDLESLRVLGSNLINCARNELSGPSR